MEIEFLFDSKPFSLKKNEIEEIQNRYLFKLIKHHTSNCIQYKNILESLNYNFKRKNQNKYLPFVPVSLFKKNDFFSVPKTKIIKTLVSSGTTSRYLSKIYLDRTTALNQKRALMNIVQDFIGKKRLPMLIIDSENILKDRKLFSARGAGILGFSTFGKDPVFVLNDDMTLNKQRFNIFLEKYSNRKFLIFGFTYLVYDNLIRYFESNKSRIDLSNSLLIHGGGWKKLEKKSIGKEKFKKKLLNLLGIEFVHDYYGMVEQTGSIFIQCNEGNYHCSIFSDVFIRNPKNFSLSAIGEEGIIQSISVLPYSYPGFSLLTEDIGCFSGVDNCPCGRLGKYFQIKGRIENSELRGCSDVYQN